MLTQDRVYPGHLIDRVTLSGKRYVGTIRDLRGNTAFDRPSVGNPCRVMVQFEDQDLQEARGGWQFAESDLDAAAH